MQHEVRELTGTVINSVIRCLVLKRCCHGSLSMTEGERRHRISIQSCRQRHQRDRQSRTQLDLMTLRASAEMCAIHGPSQVESQHVELPCVSLMLLCVHKLFRTSTCYKRMFGNAITVAPEVQSEFRVDLLISIVNCEVDFRCQN